MYQKEKLDVFIQNWSEAIRTAKRLQSSLDRLESSFPIEEHQLQEPYDESLHDSLDAFRVRYADLQDCIGNKLFRGVLLLVPHPSNNHTTNMPIRFEVTTH